MKRRIGSLQLKMPRLSHHGPKRLWWKSSSRIYVSITSSMFLKFGETDLFQNIYQRTFSRIEKVRMEKSKIDLESCDGVSEYEFPEDIDWEFPRDLLEFGK